ncbi:MAG TPA: tRNA (adenosine(37)-N6)-dimethylallyltransferase MiaA [Bacteroidales bacterium]|nr:tRNA (adenosine(37)-N6)-dimethylallyltransferase MiaA [Bacteroidales bacterium]HCI54994.1 tRNA (adenosine(37)-N6)-dimethylallyltransferase MiaA [Bacteroidales bacterium]HOU95748.1 tRNA (adenosine(37)-N6)-dimethylallyltransferase MiaA [Bacteroidales bacterium]HQG36732.1 tRNA (adenosine(37)-N6)-dimethylallyltransferase MiaA [Bacteroidales bacterium]HQG52864.1 tRNA (adenosine(37)-N6)-dimethylallyltransferase MiaA [Bacteroidales bacterium]
MRNTLIVILGPTASGKTELSIEIASYFGTEIISSDSRQFYREMKIGTSVPDDEQLNRIKHHFIRFISIHDYYNAFLYEKDVLNILPSLFKKNSVVIMCGGSGLYIDAVCKGMDYIPDIDPAIREKYSKLCHEEGIESLRIALKMMDPEYYRIVDLRNPRRIIRALEICEAAGRPYSSFLKKELPGREFRIIKVGLERPRDELYRRINERVDRMMAGGMEEEARDLYGFRHLNALQTVGYRELFDYFDRKIDLDSAINLIKQNTRRYAKRQITWWARDDGIKWFHPDQKEEIIRFLEEELAEEY